MKITITRQVGDHILSAETDPANHVTHREVLRELDRAEALVSRMTAAMNYGTPNARSLS